MITGELTPKGYVRLTFALTDMLDVLEEYLPSDNALTQGDREDTVMRLVDSIAKVLSQHGSLRSTCNPAA